MIDSANTRGLIEHSKLKTLAREARKSSLEKATKASLEKRARDVEDRRSRMATFIEDKMGIKELSSDYLMHVFKVSQSSLKRDVEALREQGLLPRSFSLKTRKQIDAERSKGNREEKIRNYIGQGFDNQEISKKLRISVRRVRRLVDGMKARGDRRLETAIEYARRQKKLKIFRERDTWIPAQKLTNADQIKALELELGESLEARNFKNMVTFNLEELEAMREGRESGISTTMRKHLFRAGILIKDGVPREGYCSASRFYISEKALQLMDVLRTSEASPIRIVELGELEDESLVRAVEVFDV